MDCKDFEKDIFLFEEISERQKAALKLHIETCANCAKLFKEVTQMGTIVKAIAAQKIVPNNAAKLTSGILGKINSSASLSWGDQALNVLRNAFTKIALGSVSTILLITFSLEFFNDTPQIKYRDQLTSGFAILNSKLFKEETVRQRNKTSLFAECTSPFKTHQYVVNCIKSKLK